MAVNNQQFVLNTMNWLSGNLTNVSTVAPANSGLPTSSSYMAKAGQSNNLASIVTTVAADVLEFKDYQENLKNGVYTGNKSYAITYKESYSGGGSGGCTLSRDGSSDPTLPVLLLVAVGYLFRPRRQPAH
ncbi:MAG: JDVT-CTERM domain-containing protein [Proteobacteria bacterium]|nr:JDVT-CTERM domain-containing protein [Pseudomonadota bacterium]